MTAAVARCMKARRSSRVACGCWVLRGQLIVRRDGSWRCLACALAEIGTAAAPDAGDGQGDEPG